MDTHRSGRLNSFLRKSLATSQTHGDSGSESAPLLSSVRSYLGQEQQLSLTSYRASETNDLDSSPGASSSRLNNPNNRRIPNNYSAISAKRSSLLANDNIAKGTSLPVRFQCDHESCNQLLEIGGGGDDGDDDGDDAPAVALITEKSYNLLDGLFGKSVAPVQAIVEDVEPKQSSLVTIFSVWNTILGSSMLTMPWGIYMAGFVPAIVLILTMSGLCLFTAYKLLQVHKYHGGGERIEVMELSRYFLGSWAEHLAKIFSVSVLMGANIAYWILMSNFLYNSVNFVYDTFAHVPALASSSPNQSDGQRFLARCPKEEVANGSIYLDDSYDSLGPAWDLYRTVPIFLAFLVFPILNFNTTTFFTKFNSLGTASIVYLVIFVLVKSTSWGVNMDRAAWEDSWILRSSFPALTGVLSLSFFIHNIIITIMQSNRNQTKNGRDLTIAYVLVTITYIIVGIVFYVCFPLAKRCIEDNLLNNFQKNDGLTVGARVVLLFQLFTVYPLIAYMLRKQLLASFIKSHDECRQSLVLVVNLAIVTICALFAIFLPRVGTIVRYTGAISGLVYVFMLPSLLHLVVSRRQGTVTTCQVFWHACVPVVGIINLISQFFVPPN